MKRFVALLNLAILFVRELTLSGIRVAALVLDPNLQKKLNPGLIDYPLTLKTDAGITLLASLITLTPGTLSVDVSADRTTLTIHALVADDPDAIRASIRNGFERAIERVIA